MPIRVICECGSRLDAPDELAGRKAKCGNCGQILVIDAPSVVRADAGTAHSESRLPPRVTRKRKKVFRESASLIATEGVKKKSRQKASGERSAHRNSRGGILTVWSRGLKFPLQREALITLLVLAFLYGLVSKGLLLGPGVFAAGIIGIKSIIGYVLITMLIVGYLCYFLFQTLRSAAQNDDDLPVAASFDFEEIFIDLWLMAGGTFLVFLPMLLLGIAILFTGFVPPDGMTWLLFLALLFCWPMAVTSAALHMSVLGANHWTVAMAILRIPFQYLATLAIAAGLVCVVLVIDYFLPPIFLISGFISSFLFFYTVVACVYLIGNLYYHNRVRIGWFREPEPRY